MRLFKFFLFKNIFLNYINNVWSLQKRYEVKSTPNLINQNIIAFNIFTYIPSDIFLSVFTNTCVHTNTFFGFLQKQFILFCDLLVTSVLPRLLYQERFSPHVCFIISSFLIAQYFICLAAHSFLINSFL